jgi:hypothetical protein
MKRRKSKMGSDIRKSVIVRFRAEISLGLEIDNSRANKNWVEVAEHGKT